MFIERGGEGTPWTVAGNPQDRRLDPLVYDAINFMLVFI